ncbi:HEAT repeat domain-containing protein [Streptomyces flavofungini]|uniref:HEAT repeat domain-containing protein n=1 Tax=Streptomyces flavofungini TaxID=68200 RepID=A0ABS0X8U4_9ACTN|nr:HEAT repeat domain-containing protein [Streptomyces flavofungini]MBJ3809496.1 HEAT repeat domain-containing protein [Streptomyces flavofungini]GHC55092.1 hypothetical protein GCM10010349_21600 [Streptomyces flavofungini]
MEGASSVADLVRMRMDGDVAGLCRATRSEVHDIRVDATMMLGGSTGSPEVVEALFACLRRRDEQYPGLRWQAAVALGKLRERRAVPELLRILIEERDTREQLDEPTVGALVAIGGPEAVRGLVGLCDQLATGRGYWTVRVLDALARLRPPEAVTPLLAALWGYLPERAERVVRTLGAIGDPRAASALLVLAHSPAPGTQLRGTAVAALHALPDADWPPTHHWPPVERLLHAPQRDPDPETARVATVLLSRTEDGRDHLWGVLRTAASDPHHPDCPPHAVAAVCARVAERPGLFDAPDPGDYHALLRHHLRESAVPAVRRAAARALAAYARADASEALLEALGDARISDDVANAVARLPKPPLRELLDLLTGTDHTVAQQRGATRALGAAGHTAAAPALLAVLSDDAAPTALRSAAAEALGALRPPEAAAPLAALAEDEEEPGTLRAHAVRALGLIGAPHTFPVVLACAGSPHEAVRARAVPALGGFPMAEAARALGEFVSRSAEPQGVEPDVARAAVHALGRIGAPALPVLVALAGIADDLSENLADRLVAALAARPEAEATAVLGRLATSPSARNARGTKPGEGRLSASRPVREAVATALSERATPECVAPLAAVLATDMGSGIREAAVRALLRIGTDEAHEHVLAHCYAATHLYSWHVEALDVIAEARGIRLGP